MSRIGLAKESDKLHFMNIDMMLIDMNIWDGSNFIDRNFFQALT